jgi:hypothetical protein
MTVTLNKAEILHRAPNQRPKNLPHELRGFPYINGSVLLNCAEQFDWSCQRAAVHTSDNFFVVVHSVFP